MALMGGGSSEFAYKTLIFSLAIMVLLPLFLGMFAPAAYQGDLQDEVLTSYERMTGQKADTKVSVWPLTGVYTPFTGTFYDEDADQTITYGTTKDGWIYGTEVKSFSPSQYLNTSEQYTVYKSDDGVFRYYTNSADYNAEYGTGHEGAYHLATAQDVADGKAATIGDLVANESGGEIYTEVNFDKLKKSDIFFTEATKQSDSLGNFKYDYSGYRMAFQPISNYNVQDQDGNVRPVIATTTSLSLIWYQTAGQSGVSGNLVLSGSDSGVAYINAAQILAAFNSNTNTAAFDLVFNGVNMTIFIKIDPVYTNQGWNIQQCYNEGFWSIMVTSLSVDSTAYTGTDNVNNPMQIFETMIDLLTFNLDDYDMAPWLEYLCYFVFIAPLYIALIVLCLDNAYLWVLVGLLAAIQSVGSFWPF